MLRSVSDIYEAHCKCLLNYKIDKIWSSLRIGRCVLICSKFIFTSRMPVENGGIKYTQATDP